MEVNPTTSSGSDFQKTDRGNTTPASIELPPISSLPGRGSFPKSPDGNFILNQYSSADGLFIIRCYLPPFRGKTIPGERKYPAGAAV
jgi:hypothetical protein